MKFRIVYDKHRKRYFLEKRYLFFFWERYELTVRTLGGSSDYVDGTYGFKDLESAKIYWESVKLNFKKNREYKLSEKQKNRIVVVEYINFDL